MTILYFFIANNSIYLILIYCICNFIILQKSSLDLLRCHIYVQNKIYVQNIKYNQYISRLDKCFLKRFDN